MSEHREIEDLMEGGAGRPAPDVVTRLYHEAFARFGTSALWNQRPGAHPTIAQAIVVAQGLRREGGLKASSLATQIEDACRAAL